MLPIREVFDEHHGASLCSQAVGRLLRERQRKRLRHSLYLAVRATSVHLVVGDYLCTDRILRIAEAIARYRLTPQDDTP